MEEHPVPHNVLEIEFKLFGAFSVRQFMRILLGGLIALVVYVLNLPSILSIPLIMISLTFGVASALINNFDSQANTILSAVLVSPRYIWRRNPIAPEFLVRDYQNKVEKDQKLKSAKNKLKVSDMEIDELLKVREERRKSSSTTNSAGVNSGATISDRLVSQSIQTSVEEDIEDLHHGDTPAENFSKFYNQSFEVQANTPAQDTTIAGNVAEAAQGMVAQNSANNIELDKTGDDDKSQTDIDSLYEELSSLKNKLNSAQKSRKPQLQIQAIKAQIDSVYKKIKNLENQDNTKNKDEAKVEDSNKSSNSSERHIYGYIVDKSETPLDNVYIQIKDSSNVLISETYTDNTGTFETNESISPGNYIVTLKKQGYRFDQYKIPVGTESLPAYKFRSK